MAIQFRGSPHGARATADGLTGLPSLVPWFTSPFGTLDLQYIELYLATARLGRIPEDLDSIDPPLRHERDHMLMQGGGKMRPSLVFELRHPDAAFARRAAGHQDGRRRAVGLDRGNISNARQHPRAPFARRRPAIVAPWPPILQFVDQQPPERKFLCLKSAPSAILIFRQGQLTPFATALGKGRYFAHWRRLRRRPESTSSGHAWIKEIRGSLRAMPDAILPVGCGARTM
jgi:hypothetical protein